MHPYARLPGSYQDAPFGYLGPFDIYDTPVHSSEMLT